MTDITFKCPYCSKRLIIDVKGAGLHVECPACGNKIQVPQPYNISPPAPRISQPSSNSGISSSAKRTLNYASPWKRLGAALIDLFISFPAGIVIGLTIVPILTSNVTDEQQLESVIRGLGYIAWWVYYASMESSSMQATLGKIALGLKVTDLDGNRIGFWKASGRHWSKFISAMLLLCGFLMIFFTQKKQGLHDIMSGCVILNKRV